MTAALYIAGGLVALVLLGIAGGKFIAFGDSPAPAPDGVDPSTPAAIRRRVEVEASISRHLPRRELRWRLARAEYLLEVRAAGMANVVQHNGDLEARLRALAIVEGTTVEAADIDVRLVAILEELGDKYGPLGTIRAAIAILGAPR